MIRNEYANPLYTTPFMCALFEEEGKDLFDVRQAILGHLQQGGNPSPFDRIQATRLAAKCIEYIIEQAGQEPPAGAFIGLQAGRIRFFSLEDLPRMQDNTHRRPKDQWWLELRPIVKLLAQPGPEVQAEE
jgi:6-phosphofructokinase 1